MDPFQLQNLDCCGTEVSPLQEQIADYYDIASKYIFGYVNNAYAAAIYGKDPEQWFNRINDLHYLAVLLFIINDKRQQAYDLDGTVWSNSYICNTYHIDCIKRTFMCKGIDITSLLEVFNILPCSDINDGTGTSPCPPTPDGIGYMHIESGPTCEPIFIVD